MDIRLTTYSHGAGCGCKISPRILDAILSSNIAVPDNDKLIVGNDSRDDAAVYDLGDGKALISTTDFFMPIVDDPFDFGRIAAANAISDIYAMGGKPILAIAILGWPINKLSPEIANQVIKGARQVCGEAGICIGGGHSIDSPEPIFGLAVNGLIDVISLKRNSTANEGDVLFLTKSIGIGILTTAEKKGILEVEDENSAKDSMIRLNSVGAKLGNVPGVSAMTDVTGFGLLGHLIEMCEGSNLSAELYPERIRLISHNLRDYINKKSIPGGTLRNIESYGHKVRWTNEAEIWDYLLSDPQTSGGLLFSVKDSSVSEIVRLLEKEGLSDYTKPIGKMIIREDMSVVVG